MNSRETDPVAIRNLFPSGGSVFYAFAAPHVLLLFLHFTLILREWKWIAVPVLLLFLDSRTESFQFLWRRTASFRGSLIWQSTIQVATGIAAFGLGNTKIAMWGIGAGAVLLLFLGPHERRFC